MTYILTIYFIFAFGVESMYKTMPNLEACKVEGERILAEINVPPSVELLVGCTSTEPGIEV